MLYEYYPDGIRGVKTVDSVPTVYLVNSGYIAATRTARTPDLLPGFLIALPAFLMRLPPFSQACSLLSGLSLAFWAL